MKIKFLETNQGRQYIYDLWTNKW